VRIAGALVAAVAGAARALAPVAVEERRTLAHGQTGRLVEDAPAGVAVELAQRRRIGRAALDGARGFGHHRRQVAGAGARSRRRRAQQAQRSRKDKDLKKTYHTMKKIQIGYKSFPFGRVFSILRLTRIRVFPHH